jgi:CRISPR-associated endonuclease Csn1
MVNVIWGLDTGTNSLGWAVFAADLIDGRWEPVRLLDGGVRLFDSGRHPKHFSSLEAERGGFRRARRQARQRRWRRDQLLKLLAARGIVPPSPLPDDVLALRVAALERPLAAPELAAVLRYLARHRGFKSLRLALQAPGSAPADEDGGRWAEIQRAFEARLAELPPERRSVAVVLAEKLREVGYVRAREGIGQAPTRKLIAAEFALIRAAQAPHHRALYGEDWDRIEELILDQRPITPPPVGRCAFRPDEDRIAKAMPSAQRARILMALANLRVIEARGGLRRALTVDEFAVLAEELGRGGVHTWPNLRKKLGLGRAKFSIETEKSAGRRAAAQIEGDAVAALFAPVLPDWPSRSLDEQDDIVAGLLADRRDRRALLRRAEPLGLSGAAAHDLADAVQFSLPRGALRFGATAARAMIDGLKPGVTVRDVENQILGQTESERQAVPRLEALPDFAELVGEVRNVSVRIALGQIKLIGNKLLARYGRPRRIVIEMARELKGSAEDLRRYRDQAAKREAENRQIDAALLAEIGPTIISPRVCRLRWRLRERQGGLCLYTGAPISVADLGTELYDVDHIIPRRLGGNDGIANLALVKAEANREKGGRTPHAAFSSSAAWPQILRQAEALGAATAWRFAPDAAARLDEDNDGWLPRQITDTSYIARTALKYLAPVADEVVATKGAATGWLRSAWLLTWPDGRQARKSRADHRHHYIDAVVIAVTGRRLAQVINTLYSRHGFLPRVDHPDVAALLGEPFPGFADQVTRRWHTVTPSIRPDHPEGAAGKLHDLPYGVRPVGDGKVRATRRLPVEAIFAKGSLAEGVGKFVNDVFAQRFQWAAEQELKADPTITVLEAARRAAQQPHFGPRGIGKIKVWDGQQTYDPADLPTVARGNHRAFVDTRAKAWVDIVESGGKWKAVPVSLFDAARGAEPTHAGRLVMRLRLGDVVAWEKQAGRRELMKLKQIWAGGKLLFWPLLAADELEEARKLGYEIPGKDGIPVSGSALRARRARAVTISPLGRLRDPGFRP